VDVRTIGAGLLNAEEVLTPRKYYGVSDLFRYCDRMPVLHEGKQMGIVYTGDASQEEILTLVTDVLNSDQNPIQED
jgi:hypothetical protein